MAEVLAFAAGWGPVLVARFNEAKVVLADAATWYVTLPTECRASISHAASACLGTPPKYFPAWGWVAMGILVGLPLGILVACLAMHDFGRVPRGPRRYAIEDANVPRPQHLPPPPGLQAMPPWHPAAQRALQHTADVNRRLVLRRLLDDGDEALTLLAASLGVSRRAALARMLGETVVQQNGEFWGLQ